MISGHDIIKEKTMQKIYLEMKAICGDCPKLNQLKEITTTVTSDSAKKVEF